MFRLLQFIPHALRPSGHWSRPEAASSRAGRPRRLTGVITHYRPELVAASVSWIVASLAVHVPVTADWMGSWKGLLDLFLSVAIFVFVAVLSGVWLVDGLYRIIAGRQASFRIGDLAHHGIESPQASDQHSKRAALVVVVGNTSALVGNGCAPDGTVGVRPVPHGAAARRHGLRAGRRTIAWAFALLLICSLELATHSGERNGFVASSRPDAGVETWTIADGYAVLLDGLPAQGDGLHLLPMLRLFLGDQAPQDSEFDRRAGHIFLVSLLARELGTYWSFAVTNVLAWWVACLCVWWLGTRRWPGTPVPWLASALTATSVGFTFMAAAPQAHAVAFAAFAVVLALSDALGLWRPAPNMAGRDGQTRQNGHGGPDRQARQNGPHDLRRQNGNDGQRPRDGWNGRASRGGGGWQGWAKIGWAAGAAGLIYLVHLPCLLFIWLYGLGRAPLRGLLLASMLALAIVFGWQWYGQTFLGLGFASGNNDLVGEAIAGWRRIASQGVLPILGQFHASSLRGLLAGAFYYPWWVLALVGAAASPPEGRRWALAVMVACALPAIAFSTRFNLPRVAFFMYPAMFLLVAQGIVTVARASVASLGVLRGATRLPSRRGGHADHPVRSAGEASADQGVPSDDPIGGAPKPPEPPALATSPHDPAIRLGVAIGCLVLLAVIANVDLAGIQQLNLWFHYSQGNGW